MEMMFDTMQNCFNKDENETLDKIKEKPDQPYLYRRLARSLNKKGKAEEATEVLKHALEVKPDDWETNIALTKLYEDTGKLEEAIALNRKGITIKPESPTPYDRLQRIFIRSGRIEEAIALYRDVDRDSPIKEKSYDRLYRILVDKAKDPDRAMKVLEEAIEAFGPNLRRCKDLGRLLFKKKKWDEASEMFESALSFKKDDMDIMNYLAWCLIEVEDYVKAEKYFRKILGLKATTFAALIGLAELNIRRGSLDEAEKALDKLESRYPDNSRIEIDFAEIGLKRGDIERAISRCEKALKKVANYFIWEQIHGHRVLSEAYRKKGNGEEAGYHQVLAEGLSRGPDAFKAIVALAEERIEKNDLKLARRLVGRLIDLYPSNTRGHVLLGDINLREDRIEDAITSCKHGLQHADQRYIDEQVRGHRILAKAYKRLNKEEEAEKSERKAVLLEELATV